MLKCALHFEMFSSLAILFVLISITAAQTADETDYLKPKRAYSGVSGLTPFPRTGRSDPEIYSFENSYNMGDEYEDFPHEVKRFGLIPFPRVGRSDRYLTKEAINNLLKRGAQGGGNGMWFGPRLGRTQKRNSEMRDLVQGDHV
ncbi:Cardio acceleratory peptide 2b [Pseudolycoriella hygida]|uniref:Cardio acceleratory peptide 2b n=1 Tax=Pseudolycoriella hygida TaxID=35572 RepID=A0A9Q0RVN7_9DIPT|nr:Cardio acceleratory peptide 2b [Pseudolycoriella hygida]